MSVVEIFSYPFMLRALAAGVLIALLCGALGVFLVLRRLSLIGDGLAHVSFGAVAAALFLGVSARHLSVAAIPVVMLAGVAIHRLMKNTRFHGDAAIGIVSAAGVSAGVILTSVAGGTPVDMMSFLFGNILSITDEELLAAAILCAVALAGIVLSYHELFATTFDEDLARTSGVRVTRVTTLLTVLTAVTVVLSMRLVGVMLISALLIIPASTALTFSAGFRATILLSIVIAIVSVIAGVILSVIANLPTGATIIVVCLALFLLATGYDSYRRSAAGGA